MTSRPVLIAQAEVPVETSAEVAFGGVSWRTLISGDRTPTEGLTMGVAEVLPDEAGRFRLHRHAQAEIYYILSGRGRMRIGDQAHDLAPGDTVFIPGMAWHAARCVGTETLRLLYVFAADSFEEVIYEFQDS